MKVFFISIVTVFTIFWSLFFIFQFQKNDFNRCPAFREIKFLYQNDIYKDIPLELKEEVISNYTNTSLLKINKCSLPKDYKALGYLQISRNTSSLNYFINQLIFNYFTSKSSQNEMKNKVLFDKNSLFSHSFYFDRSFSTIIESFQNNIQDIHIINPDYYMDIRLMNNIDSSPFSILTNKNFSNNNTFLNIQMFYTDISAEKIEKTKLKLSNSNFSKEFSVNSIEDNVYSYENQTTKIRSTTFQLGNTKDFEFLKTYIKYNFNIDISKSMDYLKNNLNLNLGFNEKKLIIDVFHSKEKKSFSINILYN